MATWPVWLMLTIETAIAGGITLLVPKITRRGLLFGVYVGETNWQSEQAVAITRQWYRAMAAAVVVAVALGIVLGAMAPDARLGPLAPLFIVLVASLVNYLRAHVAARDLAVQGAPVAAAALVPDSPADLTIPLAALGISLVIGIAACIDAWTHYPALPARMPTHFGPSGTPDAWSTTSLVSVMVLPLMAVVMSVFLGTMAAITARAKRALRQSEVRVSLEAQRRFRYAVSTFLSGVTVLTAVLLGGLSFGAVRVALGWAERLPWWSMATGGLLLVYALGGTFWLMLRYGQGGARLERAAERAPLTNGLADNDHWVWGAFYVNRDDPSWMVEKRFGFGYTLNFGNPKAVGLFVVFLIVVITMATSVGR